MKIFSFWNHLIDILISPFHGIGPVLQIVILSLISTIILLAAFKRLSNQELIKQHKNKIYGNFLEIAIYRDQFRRSLICQGRIIKHNLLYVAAITKPLLLFMAPVLLVCLQLEYRLGYQVMKPGQSFIIEAQLDKGIGAVASPNFLNRLSITTSDSIDLETPAMQIPATGQVFWKARLTQAGAHNFVRIALEGQNEVVHKKVAVDASVNRFTPTKTKIRNLGDLLTSGEDPIPSSSQVKTLRIAYLPAEYPFFKWTLSPIVYFFILTLLFGILLKPTMKVSI